MNQLKKELKGLFGSLFRSWNLLMLGKGYLETIYRCARNSFDPLREYS